MTYRLSFGGVPFVSDEARVVRSRSVNPNPYTPGDQGDTNQRSLVDLVDEINRKLPWQYLNDYQIPNNYPGRSLGNLAHTNELGPSPSPSVRIGDYYYPTGVRRWSVFRGLASSVQVKEMMRLAGLRYGAGYTLTTGGYEISTSGSVPALPANELIFNTSGGFGGYTPGSLPFGSQNQSPQPPTQGVGTRPLVFVIENTPTGASHPLVGRIATPMYLLPPRPIGETAGGVGNGLYLVTLVDERFFFQSSPATLHPYAGMTWAFLLNELAVALGISLSTLSAIEAVYGTPELDSQLWANAESAAFLLEAVARNVGRIVTRQYDGTYVMMTHQESYNVSQVNRKPTSTSKVVRVAGGDMFASGTSLPAGDLQLSKTMVVPNNVYVTFPKYVAGNDPVPHYVNPRPRDRTSWYEDSYGDVYKVQVPIQSGGVNVSGLAGTGDAYFHNTAKALLSGEASIASGTPLNNSGLVALSVRIAKDYYDSQSLGGLDESFAGILAWTPEGLNDLIFTVSDRSKLAMTRVQRKAWTDSVEEFQHAAPAASGVGDPGVGGKSVALTVRDGFFASGTFRGMSGTIASGGIYSTLSATLTSAGSTTTFASYSFFPSDQRWYGRIRVSGGPEEVVLFEGSSGGQAGSIRIVQRGALGTSPRQHANGSVVSLVTPDAAYNVNLLSFDTGQFVAPGANTSGGVQEVKVIPQTQTVMVLDGVGADYSGVRHFSGRVRHFDPSNIQSGNWVNGALAWVIERTSGRSPRSGVHLDGQFVGWAGTYEGGTSGTVHPAPIYAVETSQQFTFTSLSRTPVVENASPQLRQPLYSGALYSGRLMVLNTIDGLPTNNRWWASVLNTSGSDAEIILMDGTSGGITSGPVISGYMYGVPNSGQLPPNIITGNLAPANFGFFVSMAGRAQLGTQRTAHNSGRTVYGTTALWNSGIINTFITAGVGREQVPDRPLQGGLDLGEQGGSTAYSFPGGWLSGTGQQIVKPQFSYVRVMSASGVFFGGSIKYSGILVTPVLNAATTANGMVGQSKAIWIQNINDGIGGTIASGGLNAYYASVRESGVYLGMFAGWSSFVSGNAATGLPVRPAAEVYYIDVPWPPQNTLIFVTQSLGGIWYRGRMTSFNPTTDEVYGSGPQVLIRNHESGQQLFLLRNYNCTLLAPGSSSGIVYSSDIYISG